MHRIVAKLYGLPSPETGFTYVCPRCLEPVYRHEISPQRPCVEGWASVQCLEVGLWGNEWIKRDLRDQWVTRLADVIFGGTLRKK